MSLRTVRILLWLPLIAFLAVLGLVASGLIRPHDVTIHSQMIGKPLPAFTLPALSEGRPLTTASFADGRPRLVNVFASWCVPCASEGEQLAKLKAAGVAIDGIAIRDRAADTLAFLQRYGNPYERVARDDASAFQVALGSSGVPETFLIDGHGIVRQQYVGPIRDEQVASLIESVKALR
jgi:cytochrome c biogenesis protein CcmG, thiol:disulfide interchange protein DsbE